LNSPGVEPRVRASFRGANASRLGRLLHVRTGLPPVFVLSATLVCLAVAPTPSFARLNAGWTGGWPPAHVNHTPIDEHYQDGNYGVNVVAVGDILGSRQIVLWLEFYNAASSTWWISPAALRVRIDGGDWRVCYYSCWSSLQATQVCTGFEHYLWDHQIYGLEPNLSTTFWAVFELPKYEFDSMKSLSIELPIPDGKILADVSISSERKPERLPYIQMVHPVQGRSYSWLGSVRFRVLDTNHRPINWSMELDGGFLSEGTAGPTAVCPIEVEESLESRQLSDGPHHLVVRATDGRVSEVMSVGFSVRSSTELGLKWAINTSAVFSGMTFGEGYEGCQTVWDTDGDGANEIVFGTRRGHSRRIWCFDSHTDLDWIYPPIDQDGLPGDPKGKVSLVDVDRDGVCELCFAAGGRLHVLRGDGNVLWTWDDPNPAVAIEGPPQAYDVDGDGYVDFFVSDSAGYVHRVTVEGQLVWSTPIGRPSGGQPTICDIDRDGEHEVVVPGSDRLVFCLDANTGREKWRFDSGGSIRSQPVIVADVDRDREYEAVIWNDLGAVICISSIGTEIWRWMVPSPGIIRLCQAIGDVDGDDSLDMVIMSGSGMFCVDIGAAEPVTKWEINVTEWSQEGLLPEGAFADYHSSYQLIADVDGDGGLEILWLAPFPIVTDGATGRLEAYYINDHVDVVFPAQNGGWWGDVDGDGLSEWICELKGKNRAETQVYCLTLGGGFPAKSAWPEYYHCAYPGWCQGEQDWLALRGAYSNSVWFPIADVCGPCLGFLLLVRLFGFDSTMRLNSASSRVPPKYTACSL